MGTAILESNWSYQVDLRVTYGLPIYDNNVVTVVCPFKIPDVEHLAGFEFHVRKRYNGRLQG